MDNLNGIIVCPKEYKDYLLKEELNSKTFIDRTYLNMNEFENKLFGFNKKSVVIEVSNYLNTSVETALFYLKNIKYTFLIKDSSKKINKLTDIKNHLINLGFTIGDKYFLSLLTSTKVNIIGYKRTKELDLIIDYISKLTKTNYVLEETPSYIPKSVYQFSNIYDELNYVFIKISKLLDSGVSPNNIKIANLNKDYYFYANILKDKLNLPITNLDNKNLFVTKTSKSFIKKCLLFNSFEEIIESFPEDNNENLFSIIDIINDYKLSNTSPKDFIPFLSYELKKKSYDSVHFEEEIELIQLENAFIKDDNYYFVMSFDNKNAYKILSDNDYFSDHEKEKFNLDTSSLLTNINRLNTINKINSIKNLTLTFKLRSPFSKFNKTNLLEDMNLSIVEPITSIKYNKFIDDMILSKSLDNLEKYNEKSLFIDELYRNDFKFKTYDNTFKGIDKKVYDEYKDSYTNLSYSSLDNFFKCPFRYYLTRVLKISDFETTLAIDLGNFAHETLEHSYDKDFEIEKVKLPENLSNKDIAYYQKVLNHVKAIYKFNDTMTKRTSLDKVKAEADIKIKLDGFNMSFVGKIDKVLYNDESYAMIVDYKTGATPFVFDNVNYGIHMQLPMYYYMLKKTNIIPNVKLIGLYLQYLVLKNYKRTGISPEIQAEDSMKLNGYTSTSLDRIKMLSINANDGLGEFPYIDKMKLKKDGTFNSYCKVIDESDLTRLYNLTDKLILQSAKKITEGDFPIAPKEIDNSLIGCKYCDFKDVCFMSFSDRDRLPKNPFFIKKEKKSKDNGGDSNELDA